MVFSTLNKVLAKITLNYPESERNIHCVFSRTILNDKEYTHDSQKAAKSKDLVSNVYTHVSKKAAKSKNVNYSDSGIYIDDDFTYDEAYGTHIYFDENGVVIPDCLTGKSTVEILYKNEEPCEQSVVTTEIPNSQRFDSDVPSSDGKSDSIEIDVRRIDKEENSSASDETVESGMIGSNNTMETAVDELDDDDISRHRNCDLLFSEEFNDGDQIKNLKSSDPEPSSSYPEHTDNNLKSTDDQLITSCVIEHFGSNDNPPVEDGKDEIANCDDGNNDDDRDDKLDFSENTNKVNDETIFRFNSVLKCLHETKEYSIKPNDVYIIDATPSATFVENRCSEKNDLLSDLMGMLGCIYEPAQQLRNEDENVEESEIRIISNAKYSKRKILRSRKGLTLQVHHLIREKIENTESLPDTNDHHHDEQEGNTIDRIEENVINVETEDDSSTECDKIIDDQSNVQGEDNDSSTEKLDIDDSQQIRKRNKKQKKTRKRKKKSVSGSVPISNVPKRYWAKRYSLFSKFDQGILLDDESFYSVTPEYTAAYIAERCRSDLIVDGFCGAGGNAIQFAFTCERVIAIDIDPEKIRLAINNAKIYGVDDRIEFIIGDFFQIAPTLKGVDAIFLSPPWGGPNYLNEKVFSLDAIFSKLGGGKRAFEVSRQITENVAYYLPRNINIDEIFRLAMDEEVVEIDQNILNKKLLSITAYFGTLAEYDEIESNND